MTSFPKEFNVLLDKIYWLCQKAKDMWWDWKDNILELFKHWYRYHFYCELVWRTDIYLHYRIYEKDKDLVYFVIFEESWKFKSTTIFSFSFDWSEKEKNDGLYRVSRDCLDDLERFEKSLEI